jgi:hypothetical protein
MASTPEHLRRGTDLRFRGTYEVSGSWLLEIPGYRKEYVAFGTIYERTPAARVARS